MSANGLLSPPRIYRPNPAVGSDVSNPSTEQPHALASEAKAPLEATPFPVHCLPPEAQSMAQVICQAERVPADLAGPVVLGILSGCIGAGLEVQSGGTRTARANLFIVVSAESGSGKSETMRYAAAPLLALEREHVERWQLETLPGEQAEVELLNVEIARLKKDAGKITDAAARAEVREQLQAKKAALAVAEAALQAPLLTVEDTTTEKLAVLLSRRDETLFSLSSDAGSIVNNLLGRYTKGDRTDETVYLKSWTGEPCRVDRMGRESITLKRPCLAALWLVQPDKVDSLLAVQSLTDGGLLPRLLLCHSGCQPREIIEDSGAASGGGLPSETVRSWAEAMRELLEAFRMSQEPAAVIQPQPEARALFDAHYNGLVRRWHSGELRDVGSFSMRWTEQAWRIALCLHAGLHGRAAARSALGVDTARCALEIADWFTSQQLAILQHSRNERRMARLQKLRSLILDHGGEVSLRDLGNSNGFLTEEVRAFATDFPGLLTIEKRSTGGRPSEVALLPAAIAPGTR